MQQEEAPAEEVEAALIRVCEEVHSRVVRKMDCSSSGTTMVLCCLLGSVLHVANLGDSRCLLALEGGGDALEPMALSWDQCPDTAGEMERIIESGGR